MWKLVVISLAVGATVAALLDSRSWPSNRAVRARRAATGALFACVPLALLLARGPTSVWRHSGIGAGRADAKLERADATRLAAYLASEARAVRWEEEGVESSVALGHLSGYSFIVNGKTDGHAIGDAPTQVMGGVLAGLLHGNAKKALVVGLGTGSTAGWLGVLPSMERVDVVELEPAILRVARDCAPVNESVLDNAKVHVHLGDAREYLLTTRARHDVIFSEPSNPYRAGISSLYTLEFYRAERELRLATAAEIAAALPDPAVCVEALEKLEPPPADREMLVLRARCYRRANHPRAAAAEEDLLQLLDREAPLGASIPTPPTPAPPPPPR